MKFFIAAGEASGDNHGAALVAALRQLEPEASFRGFGGREMSEAGVDLIVDLVERSVMGVRKVIAELGSMVDVAALFWEELKNDPPDAVILVDYPGLNLNLARMARSIGIPVVYYICPQVWAWAPWRIERIARRVDLLLVILPFEEPLYRRARSRVVYVGNPVFDRLSNWERSRGSEVRVSGSEGRPPTLALFPGSRRHEVSDALPAMLTTARRLLEIRPDLCVKVSCQRPRLRTGIDQALAACGIAADGEPGQIEVHDGDPHLLQAESYLSLVVSGTATLEQGYFGVPMVVVYPARAWERWLFGQFSVTPHIALVNLFAGRAIAPEVLFTQDEVSRIFDAAAPLLEGPRRDAVIAQLGRLKRERFLPGAPQKAAKEVLAGVRQWTIAQ